MKNLSCTIRPDCVIRTWPRIELYQNSTLKYTPPRDFPAYWEKMNGSRLKIIRTWVTLDEIWDIETGEYNWNYQIGVDKLGEKRYYPYDWRSNQPSETLFEEYLTSYCAIAEEAILNIRRFEREVTDGILSREKYEEVCERVIEHCRTLCPNIIYIEVSNESEIRGFGKLTVQEYMPLYDCICRAVNRLNKKHGWSLKVGGTAMTDGGVMRGLWHEYMKALAEDACPDKRIDFYSFHAYSMDTNCLNQMLNMHRHDLKKYGLPDSPLFFDEYGVRGQNPAPIENLMNACGTLRGMLRSADFENFHIFPWCTYHNPGFQMSYTQYIRLPESGYAPTPNGLSVKMLFGMLRDEVVVEGDTDYRVRATGQEREIYLIVNNPEDETLRVNIHFTALEGQCAKAEIREVDEEHNNSVMNPPCMDLEITETMELPVKEGETDVCLTIPRYGFVSCRLVTL